jgi:hypothetical protein
MGRARDIVTGLGLHTVDSRTLRVVKLVLFYAAVTAFAIFVGQQIHTPHSRVVKLAIALILFWMTIRSKLPNVVAVLAFILPFSGMTVLGPTSSLAIVLVFLVWMVRVALGSSTISWRSPISIILLAFVMIHMLSFYNAPGGPILMAMFKKFAILISGILLVYLLLNFVRDEKDLNRVVWASMLSCAVIIALSLVELWFPTLKLIPWFTLAGTAPQRGEFVARWIGGPFRDGELLGEYMAVSVPIQAFMFSRARSMPKRAFWGLMMVASLVTALATMHRMPLVSMTIGVLYMVFIFRKRMRFHTLAAVLLLGLITISTMEFVLANYTPTGSVFKRIKKTEFYGAVPDSRRVPWQQAWDRSMEHPWIGHGPHYDISYTVTKMYSPHSSYLYYFYTIGAIGVGIFIWLLFTLIRMSVKYMGPRIGVSTFSTDLLAVIHIQIVVFMVDAIKINFQRSAMYFLLCWLMFGMCAACYRVAEARVAEIKHLRRARLNGEKEVPHLRAPTSGRLSQSK